MDAEKELKKVKAVLFKANIPDERLGKPITTAQRVAWIVERLNKVVWKDTDDERTASEK